MDVKKKEGRWSYCSGKRWGGAGRGINCERIVWVVGGVISISCVMVYALKLPLRPFSYCTVPFRFLQSIHINTRKGREK